MNWLSGLSSEEKSEMILDAVDAFCRDIITEKEFRETLIRLGYNATDIEDSVKQHRPPPPENDGDW